jgi:hypothetical protein
MKAFAIGLFMVTLVIASLIAINGIGRQPMKKTPLNPEDVLAVLDEYLRDDVWPPAPNFETAPEEWDIADQRLTVLRNDQQWVVIIEIIAVTGGSIFGRQIYLYSNCLQEKYYCIYDKTFFELFTAEEYEACASRHHIRLSIEGRMVELFPTDDEYEQLGFHFPKEGYYAEKGLLPPWLLLRYLCWKLNHPFFASEKELRERIRRYARESALADELRLFFQTNLWEHPRLNKGQTAADTASFRILAEMIASGDASLWARQDASRFNSCWQYWERFEGE